MISVHDRQLDIYQNEIGPLLCDCRRRLLAVFGLGDLIVGRSKHVADDLAIIRLVLDHQNALAHAASRAFIFLHPSKQFDRSC